MNPKSKTFVESALLLYFLSFTLANDYQLFKKTTDQHSESAFTEEKSYIDKYDIFSKIYKNEKKIRKKKYDAELEEKSFDQKYTMYLEETDHVLFGYNTPLFIARLNETNQYSSQVNIVYDEVKYPLPGQKIKCFDNCRIKATVTVYTDNNEQDWKFHKKSDNSSSSQNKSRRESYPAEFLDVVHPEILVVIDYETFEAHNKDLVELATYMAAFWNGVDLRFRQVKEPEVRLNIAGLVVVTDKNAEPYLKRDSTGSISNFTYTFSEVSDYFAKEFPKSWDVLVIVTHRSLQRVENNEVVGYAYGGRDCNDRQLIAVTRDAGGFEGIFGAAHELGHVFGAPHDGFQSGYIVDGPCSLSDGYIMSNQMETVNKMYWSKCSLTAMAGYLRSSYADCMRNKPDVVVPRLKKLPGKLLNRDQQCSRIYPGFISHDEENCNILKCKRCYIKRAFCISRASHHTPPAEGTSCGRGRFCLNGKCTEDPGLYDFS